MSLYKIILERNLPKLLNHYNFDKLSSTFAYSDRLFWGWKVTDFSNATLWGGIHSLSIAYKNNLINGSIFFQLFDASFKSLKKIAGSRNGLQEAYPQENSFCVTALVAFDCLSSLSNINEEELEKITKRKKDYYLSLIKPFITFLENNDETHAIISNHLATAVAAIELWNNLSGGNSARGNEIWEIIKKHQSKEGWFKEYESADPGYQTLCLYYLAAAHKYSQNSELKKDIHDSAKQSLEFLRYFIHPDGTLGGVYGSRNTEVYYPGGLEYWSEFDDNARSISDFMYQNLENKRNILPEWIDIGNYIPLLNSFSFACDNEKEKTKSSLPFSKVFTKEFPDAGIYIHSADKYYSILNYKKGGVIKVFDKLAATIECEDGGIALIAKEANQKYSTQSFIKEATFENQKLTVDFYKFNETYPTAFNTAVIRFLSITLFRNRFLGELFKKAVVKLLMTGKSRLDGIYAERQFIFNNDTIEIQDKLNLSKQIQTVIYPGGKFKSIHMASSGYFAKQWEELEERQALNSNDPAKKITLFQLQK